MSTYNLPPGVSKNDIPGNEPDAMSNLAHVCLELRDWASRFDAQWTGGRDAPVQDTIRLLREAARLIETRQRELAEARAALKEVERRFTTTYRVPLYAKQWKERHAAALKAAREAQ